LRSTGSAVRTIAVKMRFVVMLDLEASATQDLPEVFGAAVRDSIQRALAGGKIDTAQAEELLRVVPKGGSGQRQLELDIM
jgi:hypothetical protein